MMTTILPLLAILAATPAATPSQGMKAGINQKCLLAKSADGKDASALIALGELAMVRDDPKTALDDFQAAGKLGADVANAPVNFTLVKGVLWIQNDECPVPVPAPSAAQLAAAELSIEAVPGPKVAYPVGASRVVHSEGNAHPRAWIGADGKPERIAIIDVTSGPPGFEHNEGRKLGDEAGERLFGRIQFAIAALDALRGYDFGAANAGKVWDKKIEFIPTENFEPGAGPDTSALPTTGTTLQTIGGH